MLNNAPQIVLIQNTQDTALARDNSNHREYGGFRVTRKIQSSHRLDNTPSKSIDVTLLNAQVSEPPNDH